MKNIDNAFYLNFYGNYAKYLRCKTKEQRKEILWYKRIIALLIILFTCIIIILGIHIDKTNDVMKDKLTFIDGLQQMIQEKNELIEHYQDEEQIAAQNAAKADIDNIEVNRGTERVVAANYTQSDLNLLSKLIYSECTKDEELAEDDMLHCANVVINRLEDESYYPKSISEVIYAEGQYAVVNNGAINCEPNDLAIECAKRILDGERVCPSNVFYQARFKQGSGVYKQIGSHFYCFK